MPGLQAVRADHRADPAGPAADRQGQGPQQACRDPGPVLLHRLLHAGAERRRLRHRQRPAAYATFATALFDQQPEENSAGLTDDQLAAIAQQAGAGDIASCVADQHFKGWTQRTTDQASKDGLTGTPYVLVDGRRLTNPTAAALQAAVDATQH